MMLFNWGIESIKWKFLLKNHEKIPLLKSFQAVLSGTTVGLFTPNRMGEFFGRVFILNKTKPLEGILITLVGSISQLLTTFVAGSLCLIPMLLVFPDFKNLVIPDIFWGVFVIVIVINALLISLYLNVPVLSFLLQRMIKPRWINIRKYMRIIAGYSTNDLITVLLLSALRFFIFTGQYILLINMLGIPLPFFTGFMLIAVVFLLISAIPTFALSELGVRGTVALFVFGFWLRANGINQPSNEALIVGASGLLWLINIVIPALVGSIFLFRLRFIRNNNG
jgi:hypothetical protein